MKTEYGIIYIDEIDKIASAPTSSGRDVSGRGVQTNLLKLMEETEVPARSPQDVAGQLQAMLAPMQHGKKAATVINTRHILFIVSGAFNGLETHIRRRLRDSAIGFSAKPGAEVDSDYLALAQTRDFIEFGFEAEFIGRLPVRVVCQPLSVEDMFNILKSSEGSIIRQYEQTFGAYGIEVLFDDDGLRRIAELAEAEQTGARGLMTVCERVFRDFKYELPSTVVKRFVVNRKVVEEPAAALKDLLEQHQAQERSVARRLVHEFAARFRESHGLVLRFTETAADLVISEAARLDQPVRDFCAGRFKDFQFALKLISQNTRQAEFTIDESAVENPDRILSEWVVQSYRSSDPGASAQSIRPEGG